QDPELTGVGAEEPWEGSPAAGVGPLADEDAVAAHGVGAVTHDLADVLLVTDLHEAAGAGVVGQEEVAEDLPGRAPGAPSQLGEAGADRPGVARSTHRGD